MKRKLFFLLFSLLFALSLYIPYTHATQLWIAIWGGGASPGRHRDITFRVAYQNFDITSLRFDFHYDETRLFVKEIARFEGGEIFHSLDVDTFENRLSVYVYDAETPLVPRSGDIALIKTFVGEHVPRGSEISLAVTNVVVTDTMGNEIPLPDNDQIFTIPEYDFTFKVGTGNDWGGAGDTGTELRIFASSYTEVSSLAFDFIYDTDILTVTQFGQLWDAEALTIFQWNDIPDGVHVSMSDSTAFLPEFIRGFIAYAYFTVSSTAPEGSYPLRMENIVVLDSAGQVVPTTFIEGEFRTGWPTLGVTDGKGYPAGSGNVVKLILDNEFEACGLQVDIYFDTTVLSVSHMKKTERSSGMDIFNLATVTNGVRVAMTNLGHNIPIGTDPVADLYFTVKEGSPQGEYTLTLTNAVVGVSVPGGMADEVYLDHGIFQVGIKGDVNGDGMVDIADVVTTINIILELHEPLPGERSMADCMDDDVINVLDAVCIVNGILGGKLRNATFLH